jgi:predicted enzyme related to lactoylglutathione lyase
MKVTGIGGVFFRDSLLAELKANDVKIVDAVEDQEGVGRFVHIEDPEGNRVELWEPQDVAA